jgi:hypothetical protein
LGLNQRLLPCQSVTKIPQEINGNRPKAIFGNENKGKLVFWKNFGHGQASFPGQRAEAMATQFGWILAQRGCNGNPGDAIQQV